MESHEQKISEGVAGAMPWRSRFSTTLARDTADPAGGSRARRGRRRAVRAIGCLRRTPATSVLEGSSDPGGNLYMTLPGRDRAAPAWFVGSHLDRWPKGGNFDGDAACDRRTRRDQRAQALGHRPGARHHRHGGARRRDRELVSGPHAGTWEAHWLGLCVPRSSSRRFTPARAHAGRAD